MFGIGGGELVLIAFVALIVFGPQRIPELARSAARGYRELTKLRRQMDDALDDVKRDLDLDAELKQLDAAPLIRPPAGERARAGGSTPAPAEAAARLAVPDEDDYLGGSR